MQHVCAFPPVGMPGPLDMLYKFIQQYRPGTGRVIVAEVLMHCAAESQHLQHAQKTRTAWCLCMRSHDIAETQHTTDSIQALAPR